MMARDIPLGALVSYGQFLLVFLVVPIVVLAFLLRRHLTVRYARTVLTLALIAFAYTTPWDNWIIALGVWGYDPALVWGIVIGWVPLEEYLFFLLQPMLGGLIVLALLTRTRGPARGA
jgi:lycopene beta-cyclase